MDIIDPNVNVCITFTLNNKTVFFLNKYRWDNFKIELNIFI